MIVATIENLQEFQQRNQEQIAMLQPKNAMGEAVRIAASELQRYAISVTHVGRYIQSKSGKWRWARPHEQWRGGGALRASHRMAFSESGDSATATISLDPQATNPLTGRRTALYGVYEHQRGGAHAFYRRAVNERGAEAMNRAQAYLARKVVS